ncbi:MAG: hypothetical protein QHI48_05470 [Bacteroidota bacterium]|nr:hypothetical protein [Bacteroidota bacterium]
MNPQSKKSALIRIPVCETDAAVVEILHDPTDPCSWIVRRWSKRRLVGKRLELSRWFNTRRQAETFTRRLDSVRENREH